MSEEEIFSHHFLVAMPTLQDVNFSKAVVYIYEHTAEGAMGFIINKPLNVTLGSVLQHLDIHDYDNDIDEKMVLMGGPVGQEHGFVIHEEGPELCITASKDILVDISQNKGPERYVVTLGYSGWGANQLEAEINRNDWLVVPFDERILFNTPIEQRWYKTAGLLGIDINQLSGQIGHV
ncbi:MAG: YqgE/AlgH family protein [Gammaproteobacteria bacterium]|nr:YqgE/AlgH family protein [Gammaproteobacteria bacterium]MCH9743701.1 YqgE/AlgH family protein [Gammaproteobacteria bacterium]